MSSDARPADIVAGAGVLMPDGRLQPARVRIEDGLVAGVDPPPGRPPDHFVVPGFVDLQVNGVEDLDVNTADATALVEMGRRLAASGVTAWLPTLVTAPLASYAARLDEIGDACGIEDGGAVALGAHLEGPFLGGRPGAHARRHIVEVDLDWLAALPPVVRLLTLAPEQAQARAAAALLVDRDVVVSVGHTDADRRTASAVVDAGARMATHIFNAMSGLHHRAPGVAGLALTDDRLTVGLIADGVHVDATLYQLIFRAKRAARVALVSDAVAHRAPHVRDAGVTIDRGAPRRSDGTIAGSALTLDVAVGNVSRSGVPLADAFVAASATPASVLGLGDRGSLRPGARADIAVLDRSLEVVRTIVGGRTVFER